MFLCISADETIAPKDTKLFVLFTVTMLYCKAEFDTDKQDKYNIAVAKTTCTMAANVEIIKISEEYGRASSIKDETKALASDVAAFCHDAAPLHNKERVQGLPPLKPASLPLPAHYREHSERETE